MIQYVFINFFKRESVKKFKNRFMVKSNKMRKKFKLMYTIFRCIYFYFIEIITYMYIL